MDEVTVKERHRKAIEKAVRIFGTQAALGRAIGMTKQGIYHLHNADRVTIWVALRIEEATGGKVTRADLLPRAFDGYVPRKKRCAAE